MELRLGKMTSKEIAEWMGITYSTYQRNVSKRLEKLAMFADFTKYKGGVIITKIYIPTYIKNFSHDDEIYYEEVKSNKNGLSTISGLARKLKASNDEFKDLSESAIYYRMRKAGIRTFGETAVEHSMGLYGTRQYLWAVKVDDFNHYRELSDEERKIYNEIRNEYCGSEENADRTEKESLLKDAYRNNEISIDDFIAEMLNDNSYYEKVLIPFKIKTGITLVRTTLHEFYENRIDFEYETICKMNDISVAEFNLSIQKKEKLILILLGYFEHNISKGELFATLRADSAFGEDVFEVLNEKL